jgi:hypothetical protein
MADGAGIDGWPNAANRPGAYPWALKIAASTSAKPITTAHPAMRSGCGPTHSAGVRRGLRL